MLPRCRLFYTRNNNLSNYDKNNVDSPTIADCNSPGVKEGTLNENSKNTPNTEGLTAATEGHLSTIFPNRAGSWNAQMALYNGKNPCVFLRGSDTEWAKWLALATKSDLSQNIIAKTFNAQVTVKANEGYICDVPFTVPDGYELLDVVDTYILNTPAALSQQGIVEDKIRVYLQPFYGGTGGVYVKVLFKKKS